MHCLCSKLLPDSECTASQVCPAESLCDLFPRLLIGCYWVGWDGGALCKRQHELRTIKAEDRLTHKSHPW